MSPAYKPPVESGSTRWSSKSARLIAARRDTARAVNIGLTLRNWSIGFYIDQHELKGEDRSKYGDELYRRLADGLGALGARSCDRRQLYRYREVFRTYPQIVGSLSPQTSMLPGQLAPNPVRLS